MHGTTSRSWHTARKFGPCSGRNGWPSYLVTFLQQNTRQIKLVQKKFYIIHASIGITPLSHVAEPAVSWGGFITSITFLVISPLLSSNSSTGSLSVSQKSTHWTSLSIMKRLQVSPWKSLKEVLACPGRLVTTSHFCEHAKEWFSSRFAFRYAIQFAGFQLSRTPFGVSSGIFPNRAH